MGGSSGSSPKQTSTLTADQKKVAKRLGAYILPNVGRAAESAPMSPVAGLDPALEQVYRDVTGYDPSQLDGQINQSLTDMLGGNLSFDVSGRAPVVQRTNVNRTPFTRGPRLGGEATQNYFRDAIASPAMRVFDEQIAPRIASSFAGQGAAFSTRRGQEMSRAILVQNEQMRGQLAGLVREDQLAQFQADQQAAAQQNQLAYSADALQATMDADVAARNAGNQMAETQLAAQLAENAQARRQQAVAQAQQVAMAPYTRAAALQQLLQPYQAQRQAERSAAYDEWLRTRPENSPWNNLAMAYTNAPYSALYQQAGKPSPWGMVGTVAGGVIGGVAGGIATGGAGAVAGAGLGMQVGGAIGGFAAGTTSGTQAGQAVTSGALSAYQLSQPTWQFNPNAPAGQQWSQTGANVFHKP